MPAGRVAGQSPRSGRKFRPPAAFRNREEAEALRLAMHDFERAHGRRVKQTQPKRAVRRARPRAWCRRFIIAYARSGDLKAAARLCGVSYSAVMQLSAQNCTREQLNAARLRWLIRQLRYPGKRPLKLYRKDRALLHAEMERLGMVPGKHVSQ